MFLNGVTYISHVLSIISCRSYRIHHFLILNPHEINHKYNTGDDWEISATQRIYMRHPKSGGESVTAVSVQSIGLKLLDLPLKPSTAIVASVAGPFTGTGHHEVAMLRSGGTIEVVYVLDRNVSGTHIITSSFEAHRNRTIIYDTIEIDNIDGNPIFATLEVQ